MESIDTSEGRKSPTETQIRQSVLKGLWFPILTNLTNLMMEKRKDIQQKAFAVFFRLLEDNCHKFSDSFWADLLMQVVWPLLEDIRLAVEIKSKK